MMNGNGIGGQRKVQRFGQMIIARDSGQVREVMLF